MEKWHKRTEVLCFAVNSETRKIEKIYTKKKCCENYTMKKEYPISCYYIYPASNMYEKTNNLFEGDIFPNEMTW